MQHMDVPKALAVLAGQALLSMAESHRESRKIKGFHTTPPDFSGR